MGLASGHLHHSVALELAPHMEEDKREQANRERRTHMRNGWISLCRRRRCCPRITFGVDLPWEAFIEETGEGERGAALLKFTREELNELTKILVFEGYGGAV